MPEDKRPKPSIDLTAEPLRQPSLRAPLPGNGGPGHQAPRSASPSGPPKGRRGAGMIGYLFAGLLGGMAVAGSGYLVLTQNIPGFSLTDPQAKHRIKELEDRSVFIESRLRSLSGSPAQSAQQTGSTGPEALSETRSRLDTLVDTVRGLDEAVQSLSQKVLSLGQHGGGANTREAVQTEVAAQLIPLTHRLASAERDLEALTRAQSERQADARTAALTLALTNLKRAISDGRPFPAELAAVETLAGNKLPVSQLAPYKEEGVASLSELQNEFAEASRKTIEKHYSNKSNNFMGEVLSRAKSAIQVRPADSTGDSVEAILGRMNTALKTGDFKTALTQGAALEDPPQEMKDWFGRAQARVTADEAVRKTDQDLLASLTKATVRRQ
jgi:hypothetical protein